MAFTFYLLKIFSVLYVTEAVFHPRSPCPEVFNYIGSEPERDRWYGDIEMSTNEQLFTVRLELQFDRPADLLVSWLGEVTTTDNEKFTISSLSQKLSPDYPVSTRFLVKYDSNRASPQLKTIHLNKKQICPTLPSDSNKPHKRPDPDFGGHALSLGGHSEHHDQGSMGNRPATSHISGTNSGTGYGYTLRQPLMHNSNGNQNSFTASSRQPVRNPNNDDNPNYFENPSTFKLETTTLYNSFNERPIRPIDENNNEGTFYERPVVQSNPNKQHEEGVNDGSLHDSHSFTTITNNQPAKPSRINFTQNGHQPNSFNNTKPNNTHKVSTSTQKSYNKRVTTTQNEGSHNFGNTNANRDEPRVSSVSTNNCGQPEQEKPLALIVNGQKTFRGQWPWHVALYKITTASSEFICGGTLISTKTIVTAAHCVTRFMQETQVDPNSLAVYLGKYRLTDVSEDDGVQSKQIRTIHVHPRYNSSTFIGDIALLILTKQIRSTPYVRFCCLWGNDMDDESVIGKNGTVVGWGLDEHERLSGDMKMTKMRVVSRETCVSSHESYYSKYTSQSTLCAGNKQEQSACNGDSGGGLFFSINSRWYLRGLVSNTVAKNDTQICDTRHYVVFTDTSKYRDWILEHWE